MAEANDTQRGSAASCLARNKSLLIKKASRVSEWREKKGRKGILYGGLFPPAKGQNMYIDIDIYTQTRTEFSRRSKESNQFWIPDRHLERGSQFAEEPKSPSQASNRGQHRLR